MSTKDRYRLVVNEPSAANTSTTSKKQHTEMKYQKAEFYAHTLGQKYEYKMASLLYLRGLNHTEGFYLGINVDGAGAFDDLVFKYKPKGNDLYCTCLIQLKHYLKANKRITFDEFADVKGSFSVHKYYKSYCEVVRNLSDSKYCNSVLLDTSFDKCVFVIYTNATVYRNLLTRNIASPVLERAELLATGNNSDTQSMITNGSTLYEIAEVVRKRLAQSKGGKEAMELHEFYNSINSDRHFKDFLTNLEWFTEQAPEEELDTLIREEIKLALWTSEEDTIEVSKLFVEKMMSWWEEKETSQVLTETAQLWGDVIVSRLDSMNEAKRNKLEALNISYTYEEIDSFNHCLSSSLVINVTSPYIDLTGLKISQVLEKKYSNRFLFMDQASLSSKIPEVLRAWQSNWCDVLAIECSTGVTESLADLLSKVPQGKKLILLTESALPGFLSLEDSFSWRQLEPASQQWLLERQGDIRGYDISLRSVVKTHSTDVLTGDLVTRLLRPGTKLSFDKILDNMPRHVPHILESHSDIENDEMSITFPVDPQGFYWTQLSGESRQSLLKTQVDFQGYAVSLGSVLGDCTQAVTGHDVTQLLSPGAKLEIGKKIPDNIPYYIPRSLERRDYIREDIFSRSNADDYYIISQVKELDVHSLEVSYSVKLDKFNENQVKGPHHFFWTDDTFSALKFTRFCQKFPGQNVHWLAVDQSNHMYWKQSLNNVDVITENVDKSKKRIIEVEDVNERVVLVTAEPGMGKTTYLNNVARAAKAKDSSLWVIQISLNDISKNLAEHTAEYFTNLENVVDFLIDLVKNSELDYEILRSRLTLTGNVNIYLDAYDEISPYYNDKVTDMIKSMMKLKVGQIWLTSRNVMRHHLESELASICYTIKPFTDDDQINFLVRLWNIKHGIHIDDTLRYFAMDLLKKASESFGDRDREFTGIPLQCMMLGEVFAEDVKTGMTSLPMRLDLLQLFETFISLKCNILYQDKYQIDMFNPRQIVKRQTEHKMMMRNHSDAAILLLLSDREIELLKVINKSKISSKVAESFSVGEEWMGLVDGMTDSKPRFINQCFAEYFLAWWLSENISSSTVFIARKLFEPRFDTVRHFFDRLLARDCPLHNAVLSADREQVEALLTTGADVDQLDKGGRSALHLVASYPDSDTLKYMMEAGANVNTKNSDGFTPLHYAALSGNLDVVKLLLQAAAEVNAKTREYKDTPLHLAVQNNRIEVAKYLIGAGADQNCADKHGRTPANLGTDLGPEFMEWRSLTNK